MRLVTDTRTHTHTLSLTHSLTHTYTHRMTTVTLVHAPRVNDATRDVVILSS